jgi:hypothetical protein
MALTRYPSSGIYGLSYYGSSQVVNQLREAINLGQLSYKEFTLTGGQRLDTIAGEQYGDATLWWIIAAASEIGWGMQLPAGTRIRVPNLVEVKRYLT